MGVLETIALLVLIGIPVAVLVNARWREWKVKRRAEQLIALDRIARQAEVGLNQLSIGLIRKAYRQGPDSRSLKQFWTVPIHFRANDGGRGNGLSPELKLDGTDDIRSVEDQMIRMIQFDRECRD